ncbi:MAG: septal ring lytic transglycosylase RlpA family protein [Caldimonas sp.]
MTASRNASTLHRLGVAFGVLALVAGCASSPPRGGVAGSRSAAGEAPRSLPRGADGPGANPPPDLASVPDAEPRVETIRSGGANKPYQALGRDYVPTVADRPFVERGLASWYGRKFHGQRTASGEVYDMYAMTAAHPTLPIPSYARIRNPANGRVVIVRINDRGPFHPGRIVDLSYTAALKLDLLRGVAPVELERITTDEIRAGTWRRDGDGATRVAAVVMAPPVATAPQSVTVDSSDVALVSMTPSAPLPAPLSIVADAVSPVRPVSDAARGFWIQLGAFRERDGAQSFQRQVGDDSDTGWLAPRLSTFADAALFRVQAGPYASRDEAEGAVSRVRSSLGIVPMIVERR